MCHCDSEQGPGTYTLKLEAQLGAHTYIHTYIEYIENIYSIQRLGILGQLKQTGRREAQRLATLLTAETQGILAIETH